MGVVAGEPVLEIRTYRLRPGTEEDFHRLVSEQCVPLLERFGIKVVRFGPSERDEDGVVDYLLLRAFESLAARDEEENRFYGSSEWRDGPRDGILGRIESYHTVVLTAAADAVGALRRLESTAR